MRKLIALAVVGLFAQLVDGSLGMAYGVTSSSLLLTAGIAPAAASAAVHLSEVGTTIVSGASHWKFGNVDWRIVGIMAVPGGIFAFIGATFLVSLPGDEAAPWVALLLLSLGVYVVWRFLKLAGRRPQFRGKVSALLLVPLAAVAGTMDAIGGGGWGPVGTTRCCRPAASNRARWSARSIPRSSSSQSAPRSASCWAWDRPASTSAG